MGWKWSRPVFPRSLHQVCPSGAAAGRNWPAQPGSGPTGWKAKAILWPACARGMGLAARRRRSRSLNPARRNGRPLPSRRWTDGSRSAWCATGKSGMAPKDLIPLQGLRVLRPGLHLGTQKKGRMEPGHALAMALGPGQAPAADWPVDSPEIQAYLRGETLPHPGQGWCLVTASGHSLGWGKLAGGVLKNHRPKGLRRSR